MVGKIPGVPAVVGLFVSTAGQEFPLAFGVPFPPSLCSFLQAVDKFPPYKSVTWAGTNGLKGKEPGLKARKVGTWEGFLGAPGSYRLWTQNVERD